MTPDPELLRAEFIGLTVRHGPLDLERERIAVLFSDVGPRYGFDRLEMAAEGGAGMSGEEGAELVLRPEQTTSCAVTRLGYHEGIDRVTGALADALECFEAGLLSVEDITLVASWDCGGAPESARRIVADGVLGIDEERAELLGGEDLSMGLRLWRELGLGSVECALEPMHSDPERLYIRLVYSQPDPVIEAGSLRECADAMNDFLHGPLSAFVRARARR